MKKSQTVHRWMILASCFLIMSVAFSIINNINSLFLIPVTQDLGVTNSAFSLIFTIGALTTAFMSPIVGQLLTKIKPNLLMATGSILAGGGFFCYAFAKQIWAFYFIAIIVAIGVTCLTTIPIATVLTHWFEDKKGIALGIATAGAGTGSFIWMQIVSRLLLSRGYTFTYAILGLIILIICLPLTLFVMKMPPDPTIEVKQKKKFSYSDIHWSPSLILFTIGLFLLGLSISGTKMHIQPYLTYLNYPLTFNANVGSTQAIFALAGSLIGGYVFDKLPLEKSILIFVSMALISYICLIFGIYQPLLFVFAALFGICLCLSSLLPPYGTSALFGNKHYAIYFGLITMVFTFGSSIGPLISGFIADYFDYTFVWVFYFFTTLTYLILLLISLKSKKTSD